MACPYFLPLTRRDDLPWPHPARLPLGAGFAGRCCAPGHEGAAPSDRELQDCCNLGYAPCPRLPRDRPADSVRYGVAADSAERIVITWVFERGHAPGTHGHAEYDCALGGFSVSHPEPHIRRQLECYLDQYLERRRPDLRRGG